MAAAAAESRLNSHWRSVCTYSLEHMYVGVYLILRHFLARRFSHWSAAPALTLTVIARSDVVEEGTSVTAVAGSSDKVGGKKTQIVVLRPLQRSVQLRAAVLQTRSSRARGDKKKFQNCKNRARDSNDTHRTHE